MFYEESTDELQVSSFAKFIDDASIFIYIARGSLDFSLRFHCFVRFSLSFSYSLFSFSIFHHAFER